MRKRRDFNILLIARGEVNCRPKRTENKKRYTRKIKHKKRKEDW